MKFHGDWAGGGLTFNNGRFVRRDLFFFLHDCSTQSNPVNTIRFGVAEILRPGQSNQTRLNEGLCRPVVASDRLLRHGHDERAGGGHRESRAPRELVIDCECHMLPNHRGLQADSEARFVIPCYHRVNNTQ